jgi:hypothetical protein
MQKKPTLLILIGALVFALFGPCAGSAAEASGVVPRWSRYEFSLTNPTRYDDPYRDVALDVTYTRPDGSQIFFWGFYDGGEIWRARFMPDAIGRWHYKAKFSDGSPGVSGTFTCVASDLPGQISVQADNPQWFAWRGGDAVLVRALHVGDRFFARNWDDIDTPDDGDKRTAFLDWAAQQGYNTLSIASHYLTRNAKGRGEGWDTPRLWPLDAAEYRRMERILDDLAERRFIVYPFAGFLGKAADFPREGADRTHYFRYTLARLGASWNLLFNVAGPEPLLRREPFLTVDEINRAGAAIVRLDPFAHPISIHNTPGNDVFKDSPWSSYGTLQGPKTFDRIKLRDGLLGNHHPRKPLLAQETLWSGNSVHMQENGGADYSDADLRKNAFVIHFCAAYLVFADNNGDSSTGFSGTMELSDRHQTRHDIVKQVWDTVAGLPWQHTTPRPDLVTEPERANVFCLTDPGRTYLIYFDAPGAAVVNLSAGQYEIEWINAKQPADRRRAGTTRDAQRFESPRDGEDWILQLTRR